MPGKKFHYPDESLNHLVQTLETQLDSAIQMIEKGSKRPNMILIQLRRCLGIARKLQEHFPQRDYSLLRCTNQDELPWFRAAGIPRSYARTNWTRYKSEKKAAEETRVILEAA
jgi:hypothetical protein